MLQKARGAFHFVGRRRRERERDEMPQGDWQQLSSEQRTYYQRVATKSAVAFFCRKPFISFHRVPYLAIAVRVDDYRELSHFPRRWRLGFGGHKRRRLACSSRDIRLMILDA
jgi:hypothetical protein